MLCCCSTQLLKILNEIISFVFNHKKKARVGFSVNWTSKGVEKQFFTQQSLKHDGFFNKKFIFHNLSFVFKQDICIPLEVNLFHFVTNSFHHQEQVNIMKQEDLLMTSVSLMMVMYFSTFFKDID